MSGRSTLGAIVGLANSKSSLLSCALPRSSAFRPICTAPLLESRIKPRRTHKPYWHIKKTNKQADTPLSTENRHFLDRVVEETHIDGAGFAEQAALKRLIGKRDDMVHIMEEKVQSVKSPLRGVQLTNTGEWQKTTHRCGLLGRKLGQMRMWDTHGRTFVATAIQIEDNHVIKYIDLERYLQTEVGQKRLRPTIYGEREKSTNLGVLVVGALGGDPANFTKDYCGLFTAAGVVPKKKLVRFPVSEEAILPPGTPLFASHFEPGQTIDIRGRTCRRGFQGVMKRYGFHGNKDGGWHSCNKSHRRPGCIGSGRKKARVWPGQKMPGHMGGNTVVLRGLTVVRINNEHNIIFVKGIAVPGQLGEMVTLFDTVLPLRRLGRRPRFFPTSTAEEHSRLPGDEYAATTHVMDAEFAAPSMK